MTCKDCIHFSACNGWISEKSLTEYYCKNGCEDFEDKSRFIELPCKKGDILNYDGKNYKADHWNILLTTFTINPKQKEEKLRLFSVEEAEKALKERR